MIFEKVNPGHPDKVADRVAGAIVDLAYRKDHCPKIAVEVLIGHNNANIIIETSSNICEDEVKDILNRIAGEFDVYNIRIVPQDPILNSNQNETLKCGDNGIFKGVPVDDAEQYLANIAGKLYEAFPYDGKYIIDTDKNDLIICQSNASNEDILNIIGETNYNVKINPLGYWTGGINVDSGATNRKIGSDLGRAATGGGLHGKDLSKADTTLNIYAHILANANNKDVEFKCAIGDKYVLDKRYEDILEVANKYIRSLGGFETFAEWGLIRPEKLEY